jgi:hypothetical protein
MTNDLAAVGKWLDWQYEVAPEEKRQSWTLETPSHLKQVVMEEDGPEHFDVTVTLTRKTDASTRTSRKLSGSDATSARGRRRVQAALNEFE